MNGSGKSTLLRLIAGLELPDAGSISVSGNPATILLVSHDRAFLDATVSSVAELERGELRVWPGNYSEALAVKAAEQAAKNVSRTLARRAKALEKRVEQLDEVPKLFEARTCRRFRCLKCPSDQAK